MTTKRLVILNLLAGILLAVTQVSFVRTGDAGLLLPYMAFLVGFLVLGVTDLVAVFTLWKRHRMGAFLPVMSYVVALGFWLIGGKYGSRLALYGTPSEPDSFLRGGTRTELTGIANQLLGNGLKRIAQFPGQRPQVDMIVGRKEYNVPSEILSKLRNYRFQAVEIDDFQETVEFNYNHLRTWHDYIWARNGLSKPYTTAPVITAVDIAGWQALIDIAKEGDPKRRPNECGPGIGYFYLKDNLGEDTVSRIGHYHASSEITDLEKQMVMSALNKQVLVSGALIEQPEMTYGSDTWGGQTRTGLYISTEFINDGFWVVKLLKQLLSEGVVTLAPDGRHLRIKSDLTETERHQVEWLHVGIMRFLYSNLLEKQPLLFSEELGDNWYFEEE